MSVKTPTSSQAATHSRFSRSFNLQATLSLRGDLTVTYADGTVNVIPERVLESGGRSYWGVSHEMLIRDFYAKLGDPEPFWISPSEAGKSLRIVKDIYAQSYPELLERVS